MDILYIPKDVWAVDKVSKKKFIHSYKRRGVAYISYIPKEVYRWYGRRQVHIHSKEYICLKYFSNIVINTLMCVLCCCCI